MAFTCRLQRASSSIMFTRLDAERNAKTLKRATNEDRMSDESYSELLGFMDEYVSLPAKRLAHIVRRYSHHCAMKEIGTDVTRTPPRPTIPTTPHPTTPLINPTQLSLTCRAPLDPLPPPDPCNCRGFCSCCSVPRGRLFSLLKMLFCLLWMLYFDVLLLLLIVSSSLCCRGESEAERLAGHGRVWRAGEDGAAAEPAGAALGRPDGPARHGARPAGPAHDHHVRQNRAGHGDFPHQTSLLLQSQVTSLHMPRPLILRSRLCVCQCNASSASARRKTNWCMNCVLMRVMDAVKGTIAGVSSVSPSPERRADARNVSYCLFHGVHYPHQHTVDSPVCVSHPGPRVVVQAHSCVAHVRSSRCGVSGFHISSFCLVNIKTWPNTSRPGRTRQDLA